MALTTVATPEPAVYTKDVAIFDFTTDEYAQPNYYVQVTLHVYQSGIPDVVFIEYPDSGHHIRFDVNTLLDDILSSIDFAPPTTSLTVPQKCGEYPFSNITKYKVTVQEAWGDPPTLQGSPTTYDDQIAVIGGTSDEQYLAGLSYLSAIQPSSSAYVIPFLTQKKQVNLVGINDNDYLFFFLASYRDWTNFNLSVEINYEGGDTSQALLYTLSPSATRYDMYYYRCNLALFRSIFVALDIDNLGQPVVSYSVQLWDDDLREAISEKRTFIIDYQTYVANRLLYFRNSRGGVDKVRLLGTGEFMGEYSGSTIDTNQVMAGFTDANRVRRRRTINRKEQAGMKLNTGYMSRWDAKLLRDLMVSDYVWEYDGERYRAVEMTGKKLALPQESDVNVAVLEYQYLWDAPVFTAKPGV